MSYCSKEILMKRYTMVLYNSCNLQKKRSLQETIENTKTEFMDFLMNLILINWYSIRLLLMFLERLDSLFIVIQFLIMLCKLFVENFFEKSI